VFDLGANEKRIKSMQDTAVSRTYIDQKGINERIQEQSRLQKLLKEGESLADKARLSNKVAEHRVFLSSKPNLCQAAQTPKVRRRIPLSWPRGAEQRRLQTANSVSQRPGSKESRLQLDAELCHPQTLTFKT